MARLKSVGPISDEDTNALPVKEIGPAIAFYQSVLGFTVVRSDDVSASLDRDEVQIGLVRDSAHDPARAGSVAFKVDDLEALHEELQSRGGSPGQFGRGEWGGKKHRTFFLREDENGYCYCFYCPVN